LAWTPSRRSSQVALGFRYEIDLKDVESAGVVFPAAGALRVNFCFAPHAVEPMQGLRAGDAWKPCRRRVGRAISGIRAPLTLMIFSRDKKSTWWAPCAAANCYKSSTGLRQHRRADARAPRPSRDRSRFLEGASSRQQNLVDPGIRRCGESARRRGFCGRRKSIRAPGGRRSGALRTRRRAIPAHRSRRRHCTDRRPHSRSAHIRRIASAV